MRIIIGDVRGKGLDAVRLASIVLGSYRHVAYERADLRAIVADLDRAVARSVGDEDFVTAALVEERGGTLTIVNCGHPAPLLLRRGEVIPLEPPAPAPPLGFMPVVRPRVERLEPGDRLLLFTDGLGEARRDGEFFPTADRAWRLLGHGTVGDGLASLETALVEWVHGRLDDDIALVLLEYTGPRRRRDRAGARAGRSARPAADRSVGDRGRGRGRRHGHGADQRARRGSDGHELVTLGLRGAGRRSGAVRGSTSNVAIWDRASSWSPPLDEPVRPGRPAVRPGRSAHVPGANDTRRISVTRLSARRLATGSIVHARSSRSSCWIGRDRLSAAAHRARSSCRTYRRVIQWELLTGNTCPGERGQHR